MAEQQEAPQDGLTPQEAAFFASGGEQTEGLASETQATEQTQQTQQDTQTQTQQPEGESRERTVPLAALQEERAERKRLRDEVQHMRAQQDALMQRLLANQQPEPQPEAVSIPPFEQDPVGHLRAQNELLARHLQQVTSHLNAQGQQEQQYQQQQAAQQQLVQFITTDESRFRAQAPDYDAAAAYLHQSREAEYRALGMTNPMEIQQALRADIAAMANIAQRNGTSIAEAAYSLAKSRGYKALQADAQAAAGGAAQQDNAARLATIARGQQQAASLGNAGGAAAAPMSIDKLLAMDDGEFAKATSGMNWAKLNAELSGR